MNQYETDISCVSYDYQKVIRGIQKSMVLLLVLKNVQTVYCIMTMSLWMVAVMQINQASIYKDCNRI